MSKQYFLPILATLLLNGSSPQLASAGAFSPHPLALSDVAISLATDDEIERALKLLESLASDEAKADALRSIVPVVFEPGKEDLAWQLAREFPNRLTRVEVLSEIAEHLHERGQTDRAVAVLEAALAPK